MGVRIRWHDERYYANSQTPVLCLFHNRKQNKGSNSPSSQYKLLRYGSLALSCYGDNRSWRQGPTRGISRWERLLGDRMNDADWSLVPARLVLGAAEIGLRVRKWRSMKAFKRESRLPGGWIRATPATVRNEGDAALGTDVLLLLLFHRFIALRNSTLSSELGGVGGVVMSCISY